MKGSIPIPYIIAIILGVLVIIALSYFLFPQIFIGETAMHEQYCAAKCFECRNTPIEERGPYDSTCDIKDCPGCEYDTNLA